MHIKLYMSKSAPSSVADCSIKTTAALCNNFVKYQSADMVPLMQQKLPIQGIEQ
jgi:hypothetical protein